MSLNNFSLKILGETRGIIQRYQTWYSSKRSLRFSDSQTIRLYKHLRGALGRISKIYSFGLGQDWSKIITSWSLGQLVDHDSILALENFSFQRPNLTTVFDYHYQCIWKLLSFIQNWPKANIKNLSNFQV